MDEPSETSPVIRRGPGRPPGSLNKPKVPPMTPEQRKALKDELGASYRQAIIDRAFADTRTRGVTALILAKLGKGGLAEIQAEVIREQEVRREAADATSGGAHPQGLAA